MNLFKPFSGLVGCGGSPRLSRQSKHHSHRHPARLQQRSGPVHAFPQVHRRFDRRQNLRLQKLEEPRAGSTSEKHDRLLGDAHQAFDLL